MCLRRLCKVFKENNFFVAQDKIDILKKPGIYTKNITSYIDKIHSFAKKAKKGKTFFEKE
ncbi:hypothetical protein DMC01_08825 [Campylobacter troglodytis]|nr:hypothetical protein DMC01_08825 [Campylobacter troglodytis]